MRYRDRTTKFSRFFKKKCSLASKLTKNVFNMSATCCSPRAEGFWKQLRNVVEEGPSRLWQLMSRIIYRNKEVGMTRGFLLVLISLTSTLWHHRLANASAAAVGWLTRWKCTKFFFSSRVQQSLWSMSSTSTTYELHTAKWWGRWGEAILYMTMCGTGLAWFGSSFLRDLHSDRK